MVKLFVEHIDRDKYAHGICIDERKKEYTCPKCRMVWSILPKKRTARTIKRCPNECMYENGNKYSYVEGIFNEGDGLYTCPDCGERWSSSDFLGKELTTICPYGCLDSEPNTCWSGYLKEDNVNKNEVLS